MIIFSFDTFSLPTNPATIPKISIGIHLRYKRQMDPTLITLVASNRIINFNNVCRTLMDESVADENSGSSIEFNYDDQSINNKSNIDKTNVNLPATVQLNGNN